MWSGMCLIFSRILARESTSDDHEGLLNTREDWTHFSSGLPSLERKRSFDLVER